VLDRIDALVARGARGVTRRNLLRSAGGGALGAALTISHLDPAMASHASAAADVNVADDPTFLLGQIAAIGDDGRLSVIDSDGRARRAQLVGSSRYWKASAWNTFDYAVGDCVMGRGELDADDVLRLDSAWANIHNLRGTVDEHVGGRIKLRGTDRKLYDVKVKDSTIVRDDSGDESRGNGRKVKRGQDAIVIAYTNRATGQLVAHRLEAFETFGEGRVTAEPARHSGKKARAASHFNVARQGNASWFCCGNVSGCGHCGSSGTAYCSFCRSSGHYMAWPKVSSCGPYCSGCCVQSDFPRYGCGTGFTIENPCSGRSTFVQIADCGPTTRCRSTGCKSYDSVRFDLTPCAFSAVGGSFDIGHCNLWVSAPQ
jgi:hypothetical protein